MVITVMEPATTQMVHLTVYALMVLMQLLLTIEALPVLVSTKESYKLAKKATTSLQIIGNFILQSPPIVLLLLYRNFVPSPIAQSVALRILEQEVAGSIPGSANILS